MAAEQSGPAGVDRALVTAFQAGDEQVFDEIFKRYHDRIAALCGRMLRSPQDAEEATQETFLKAYQALGRFNGDYYLSAWLSRIATNVCVDHIRSKARSNLVGLPEDQDNLSIEPGPEDLVAGGHPRLERAIQEIQPLHASALALRTLEGLSHQEIAGRLRMSPSQVKALLHRARGSLRRAWYKAEGWAIAPLLGVRHWIGHRGTGDAGRLAWVSPSAAPLLIERMAASAMLVAAALGGLPSAPAPLEPQDGAGMVTPVAVAPGDEEAVVAAGAPSSETRADTPDSTESHPADDAAEVAELPARLEAELRRALQGRPDPPQPPRDESREDEGEAIGPSSADGARAISYLRRTVRTVQQTLPR